MDLLNKIKVFVWSKHFLKHLGLVILAYIVIVSLTIFYLDSYTNHGQHIDVPNLIGRNVNSVKTELEDLDLQYEILDSIYDPSKPEGTIIDQDPDATSLSLVPVKEGRIIRLRVSKKSRLVEMPSLVDKSQRCAESILENRGLNYRIEYRTTSEADGAVLEQLYKGKSVKEGAKIPIGATILLIVGQNDAGAPTEIPDLFGMSLLEAQDMLMQTGNFSMITICADCLSSEDSLAARIESQSPEFLEGIMIPAGSTITVYATKDFGGPIEQEP
jgi:beta-lactam-binding protein with PASTA domain